MPFGLGSQPPRPELRGACDEPSASSQRSRASLLRRTRRASPGRHARGRPFPQRYRHRPFVIHDLPGPLGTAPRGVVSPQRHPIRGRPPLMLRMPLSPLLVTPARPRHRGPWTSSWTGARTGPPRSAVLSELSFLTRSRTPHNRVSRPCTMARRPGRPRHHAMRPRSALRAGARRRAAPASHASVLLARECAGALAPAASGGTQSLGRHDG